MSTVAIIDPSRVRKPTPQHVLLEQVAAGRAAEGLVRLLGQLAVSEVPSDAA